MLRASSFCHPIPLLRLARRPPIASVLNFHLDQFSGFGSVGRHLVYEARHPEVRGLIGLRSDAAQGDMVTVGSFARMAVIRTSFPQFRRLCHRQDGHALAMPLGSQWR